MSYFIGFSTQPENILSKIIRWFTRAKASHAIIFLNKHIILEATEWEVKPTSWKKFKKNNSLIYKFRIKKSKREIEKALNVAMEYLNVPYDVMNIVGQIIVRTIDILFHIKIRNKWGNEASLQCSEYMYKYLKALDIPIEIDDVESISPQFIIEFCLNNPNLFEKVPVED